MKKIIFLSLTFLLLLSLLCVTGHAKTVTDTQAPPTSEREEAPTPETGAENGEVGDGDTASGAFAAFLTENADTLLGLLTLVGSLLVAFLYKTGLLPMLRAGLRAIGDTLGKSRELTERFTEDAGAHIKSIEEHTRPVLAAVERSEAIIRALEERLGAMERALSESERDRKETAAILRTETELFYELLHSVNLPEAQKEAMTESYYRLKRTLEAGV